MLSTAFHDWGGGADDPDFSVDLTRYTATFCTPEILYIICRNCYTSQGDPDSSFPYLYPRVILNIRRRSGRTRNSFLFCYNSQHDRSSFLLCTKMHNLDMTVMILFHSNMNHLYSFMVLLHCHVWHITIH